MSYTRMSHQLSHKADTVVHKLPLQKKDKQLKSKNQKFVLDQHHY